MDLQGANAGGEVDYAVEALCLQRLHQRMATKAQNKIQLRRADFQQQVGVAGEAGDQPGVVLT